MGSYLSEPETEKVSSNESNDKLICGVSSMQGWRLTQEDAHNCILNFDENTSLFAVYDGHGGHEVAQYAAQELPDFIKNLETYKSGDIEKALVEAFLGFDATITTKEIMDLLKYMARSKEPGEESDEEEDVVNLRQEAAMPIELVIKKYTSNLDSLNINQLQKGILEVCKASISNSATSSSESSINSPPNSIDDVSSSSNVENEVNSSISDNKVETNELTTTSEINICLADSSDVCTSNNETTKDNNHSKQNGEVTPLKEEAEPIENVSTTTQENGDIAKKGKGKALVKTKGVDTPTVKLRPKRNAQQLYSKLLNFDDDSEDTDEEDETFVGPNEESSDDNDEDDENQLAEEEDSEESSEEEEDDDDDAADAGRPLSSFFVDDKYDELRKSPGYSSGCTAVVALLKNYELFVANAGDSRCIVCRNGKAVEMSFDHKPQDDPERERVEKAGGHVNLDGRVDGGLNLSRAIGDHSYKMNKDLSDREQMITALPDVRKLTINPTEDEFMVLACDGIWNFMSSQEVVDFVKERLDKCETLAHICEEMFDHCLAPGTLGDGTGCDNMTAIIVRFKRSQLKRTAASDETIESENIKRIKTDEADSATKTVI